MTTVEKNRCRPRRQLGASSLTGCLEGKSQLPPTENQSLTFRANKRQQDSRFPIGVNCEFSPFTSGSNDEKSGRVEKQRIAKHQGTLSQRTNPTHKSRRSPPLLPFAESCLYGGNLMNHCVFFFSCLRGSYARILLPVGGI